MLETCFFPFTPASDLLLGIDYRLPDTNHFPPRAIMPSEIFLL